VGQELKVDPVTDAVESAWWFISIIYGSKDLDHEPLEEIVEVANLR